ncbi:MAG: endolytic transglycosylase MltG [Methylophilaceae bacterium]
MKKLKLNSLKIRKYLIFYGIIFVWIFSYPFLPLNITEENASFEINNGSTIDQITEQLVEIEILDDSFRFKLLTSLFGKTEGLKRGQYHLNKNITPYELLDILAKGKEVMHSITFIEGQTFSIAIKKIKSNKFLKKTIINYSEANLLKLIGSDKKYVEGLLFPDSYFFYKNTSDIELLRNSYEIMEHKLNYAWNNRALDLPYKDKYEALIVASIIEKELWDKNEASLIAGVFVNRLNMNMRLQSDPTVIYGIKHRFNGNLRKKDLRKDTPFNTYTRRGLPPSPICSPSLNTIIATLNPEKTDAIYFVAKGDKTHHFSKTLKEHNKAVRKYQK